MAILTEESIKAQEISQSRGNMDMDKHHGQIDMSEKLETADLQLDTSSQGYLGPGRISVGKHSSKAQQDEAK